MKENTIAVLDTGSGKTMIALMLIQELAKDLGVGEEKKRVIVFLAPTVHLVHQQYEVIKAQTNLSTAQYCGALVMDHWNSESWEKEISAHKVIVMTPQILLDALRKAFLTLDMIRLIIFDECHRASGNHPYAKIMKEFYCKTVHKPTIFGMTASPLIRKGVSSVMDCEGQLSQLESILDSKIYTVDDRSQTYHFVTAKEVNRYFDQKLVFHDDLKIQLGSLLVELSASLAHLQDSRSCQFRDAEDILNKLKKDCSSWHGKICHCLDDLGLICATQAAKVYPESVQLPCPTKSGNFFAESVSLCKYFLEKVMHAIEDRLTQGYEMLLKTEQGWLNAIQLGYITPKLFELLQILKTFPSNQVRCLVFVERIITATVIQHFIKKISYLSHLKVSYLTGGSNSAEALTQKLQKETLELFRSGKVNLVFTTNVAEEGLDIPECSCVIRFDLPKTVCSYVQSRGRARQAGSHYIIMLERGNIQQRDLLFSIIRSEHSMMDTALNRNSISLVRKLPKDNEMEAFRVHSTGATITIDSSVGLIYRYCEKLPKDKYYSPRPNFQYNTHDGSSECTLILPPGAAFQKLVGPLCRNNQKAKQLVCLDACKKLHQLGALDDHLVPIIEETLDIELSKGDKKSAAGAGTTKRKELHGTVPISALSGDWVHRKVGVTLQGYKFNFLCNKPEQKYSSFVLLVDAALDKDVACVEIDLYLVDKMVKTSVSPCGSIHLDAEQVEQAKRFHELFFNGAFGKLFKGSKSSGEPRQLLFNEDRSLLWNMSYMYMLLPLVSPCEDQDTVRINWNGIRDAASVVDFLIASNVPKAKNFCDAEVDASLVSEKSDATDSCILDMIHLANKTVHYQKVKYMVVMGIHTGKLYSIIDVQAGMSADSPFEVPDFATFTEYFSKKYGIVLQHPGQPLLLLKHSHNPHNLLSSNIKFEGNSASKKTKSANLYVKRAPNNVHMPPELLVHINLPLDVLKSLYLLPSLMHRMESLMLACQLRREIAFQSSDSCISSTLILEAITTLRCCEDFSLERLELLGDSVLKYALSCYLYLKFPEKHEGQLSSRRSYTVCNAMLHKLGVNRNLQGYIRDAVFDPRRWVAPGQLTNRPYPCKCEVSEVPCKIVHTDNDNSIVIGKACDGGHRWICSKTISDCAEALIGAYYVGGGLSAAVAMMKWLGIDVECGPELIKKSITSTCFTSKSDEIEALEVKLGYEFMVKDLLLEAITHGSQQEIGINYCYQRLEFLGDAALDLVITWHLFQTYKDIDPGELTDLRSASISNESFARCAIRHKLQQHLQHSSGLLSEQITEYAMRLEEAREDDDLSSLNGLPKGPKVLGDMVESIAGAILLDVNLELNKVWEIFKPLLSPIVTPRNLELPPVRELLELLGRRGYFLNVKFTMEGDIAVAQLSVQLEKVYLVRTGRDKKKKVAKGQAALLLLKDLEKQGIRTHEPSSPNQHEGKSSDNSCLAIDVDISMPPRDNETVESKKSCDPSLNEQVVLSVNMKKGGPRTALNELCQKSQWPRARFESESCKLSAGEKNGHLHFVSIIKLHIPNCPCISLKGEMRPDKKASQDSAAIIMLYELQKQGRCCLKEV
ncbi:endoribonuclease Dicer homolog 3a [Asparagus officinalis]|nr:endoribonuclease Dicer homolog 3a [Asparagus officinalis]